MNVIDYYWILLNILLIEWNNWQPFILANFAEKYRFRVKIACIVFGISEISGITIHRIDSCHHSSDIALKLQLKVLVRKTRNCCIYVQWSVLETNTYDNRETVCSIGTDTSHCMYKPPAFRVHCCLWRYFVAFFSFNATVLISSNSA